MRRCLNTDVSRGDGASGVHYLTDEFGFGRRLDDFTGAPHRDAGKQNNEECA